MGLPSDHFDRLLEAAKSMDLDIDDT